MSDATAFDERSRSDDPALADDRFRRSAATPAPAPLACATDERSSAPAPAGLSLAWAMRKPSDHPSIRLAFVPSERVERPTGDARFLT